MGSVFVCLWGSDGARGLRGPCPGVVWKKGWQVAPWDGRSSRLWPVFLRLTWALGIDPDGTTGLGGKAL